MKKASLIRKGMERARAGLHHMGEVEKYKGGALSKCRHCGRHMRIETAHGTIFGSATYRPCSSAAQTGG